MSDLVSLADYYGISHRQNGTSHVVFSFNRPILSVYIKKFLALLEG